jgi:hypothetical protein
MKNKLIGTKKNQMTPFITTEIYRAFHNSRPREKGHLDY